MTPLEELRLALATIDRESVTDEAALEALPVGTVVRDRNGDVFEKVSDRGVEMTGYTGRLGLSWIAYPAVVESAYRGVVRDTIADAIDHPEVFAVFEATTTTYETVYDAAALRLARSINSRTEGAGK